MQETFASFEYSHKKKVTRKEKFLSEMDKVVPWTALEGVVRPYYGNKRLGRPPVPLSKMLRVYCMQLWFNLSDPGMEDALYDTESMRRFAGFILGEHDIPDETTILNFRHLLEDHGLTERFFAVVKEVLTQRGLILNKGTIVDATIIHAPPSTKNEAGQRDPEMSSTRKGANYSFGMKVHVGSDDKHGLVHTMKVTTAKVHDSEPMDQLLHGQERAVYGDKAYVNAAKAQSFKERGKRWRVQNKAKAGEELTFREQEQNRLWSGVRSRGEHIFNIVKNHWGHRKVRYKGLYKNGVQMQALFAVANLFRVRKQLMSEAGACLETG